MKKLISILKKWNDAYPEHNGMLYIKFFDDESGEICISVTNGVIFSFETFHGLESTNPQIYKEKEGEK
jgi:hypothetical protein